MTDFLQKQVIHIVLIAIIGLFAYSNTFNVPFHFDDNSNIIENYKLRDLSNFWPPSGSRWFGFLTFALNYYFGGLNTTGYHIVNLAIHIFNAILVYWLVVLTFKTPYFSASNPPSPPFSKGVMGGFALFSALLFVAHPIQTQAVTYIVQRFTSLAAFFYLLSLVMYIKWREQRAEGKEQKIENRKLHALCSMLYAASLISAVLAMKTKEIAFTLPIVIALYEFMFFEGKIKRRILFLMPVFLTMLIIPLSFVGIDKPIGDTIGELREAAQETELIPRDIYLFIQFRVILTYIRLLFLPINQNLDYDYSLYHSFFNPEVFLSFLFLLLIFALGVYLLYSTRYTLHPTRYSLPATSLISFGIFWFFITTSVESSIIPIRDVINEHRLYLPVIGIIIVFVSATFYILQSMIRNPRRSLATCYLLLATAVIVLSIATYQRNIVWKDEITLWEDVVRKSPQKPRGHISLGFAYESKKRVDKAIENYQIAIRLKPGYAEAYYNLGNAYKDKGLTDMAIEHYQIALRIKPDYVEAHNNLGIAYKDKGLTDKAIEHYQIALRIKPDYAEAHNNLGNDYKNKGLTDMAIEHYQVALRINPNYAEAYNNLGLAYYNKGLTDKAIEHYQIALRINPNYAGAHYNLGLAYGKKGLTDIAIEEYQIALRIKPDYVEAHNNLGNAYKDKGLTDKAIEHYQAALRIKPDYAEAYNNLGIAYYNKGLTDKAIEHYQIALRIKPDYVEAHNNLGLTYYNKGLTNKAIEEYQIASRLNPDYAKAHYNLGVAYERRGLLDKAIKEYQITLRLNPENKIARNNLNRILQIQRSK